MFDLTDLEIRATQCACIKIKYFLDAKLLPATLSKRKTPIVSKFVNNIIVMAVKKFGYIDQRVKQKLVTAFEVYDI